MNTAVWYSNLVCTDSMNPEEVQTLKIRLKVVSRAPPFIS